MRVLFVAADYPHADDPGACVFIREHALAAARGAEVVVLHGPRFEPRQRGWSLESVSDPHLTAGLETYTLCWGPSPVPKTHGVARVWAAVQAARQLAQGRRFDIVHAHLYRAGGPAAAIARAFGTPLILSEHLSDVARGLLSPREAWAAALAYRVADRVLVVSSALARGVRLYGGETPVRIVPNAFSPEIFHPERRARAPHRLNLIAVSALRPVKGLDTLWPALNTLKSSAHAWHLTLIGEGPERARVEARLDALNLREQVTLMGRRSKAEIAAALRAAQVFVLPSLWENLPCALIEALASGVPAVASDVGGVREVMGPREGTLVPPRDPGALASALAAMFDAHSTFEPERLHATMRQRYSHAVVGAHLATVYQEVT